MEEIFIEKLWGKIHFLHEKTKTNRNCLNLIGDIILKYHRSLIDFSKSIENIKQLNTEIIIEEKESPPDLMLKYFRKVFKSQINEFDLCAKQIKDNIIEQIIKKMEQKYPVDKLEKDLYSQYNKSKNNYCNCSSNLEKSRNDFMNLAEICENNILCYAQLESNPLKAKTIKAQEKAIDSIEDALSSEKKYIKLLEETNKAREDEINKEKELLKKYQILQGEFYSQINNIIKLFIPFVKQLCEGILLSLNELENHYKKINIDNSLNNFIEKNKSDKKPHPEILFIPYKPHACLKSSNISGEDENEIDTLNNNYRVVEILNKNFKDIGTDLDLELEKKSIDLE